MVRLLPAGFLVPRRTQDPAASLRASPTGLSPLAQAASHAGSAALPVLLLRSYYPSPSWGWSVPPVSLALLPESLLFSFPPGTQMFHFPGFSSLSGCIPIAGCGFPHSDTAGSSLSYSSPARFAVRCVLLLRHVPRHPPYALSILIYRVFFRRLLSLRFLFLRFAFELFFPFGLSSRSICHF